jgi:hypothetical protein
LVYSALLGGGISGMYGLYKALQTKKKEGGILEYKPIVKDRPSITDSMSSVKTGGVAPEGDWYKPLAALTSILGFAGGGYGMTKLIKYLLNQNIDEGIDKAEKNIYKEIATDPNKVKSAMLRTLQYGYNPIVDEASNKLAEMYVSSNGNIEKTALLNTINDLVGVPIGNAVGSIGEGAVDVWADLLKRVGKTAITIGAPASALALLAGIHMMNKNLKDSDEPKLKSKKIKDTFDEFRSTRAVRV